MTRLLSLQGRNEDVCVSRVGWLPPGAYLVGVRVQFFWAFMESLIKVALGTGSLAQISGVGRQFPESPEVT